MGGVRQSFIALRVGGEKFVKKHFTSGFHFTVIPIGVQLNGGASVDSGSGCLLTGFERYC
jgi:hypothetical protein